MELSQNLSLISILSFCARLAHLQYGRKIHCYTLRHKLPEDCLLLLLNSLINWYARSEKVLKGRNVFDSLEIKDKITFTSLFAW